MIRVRDIEKIYGYGRNALKVLKGISLDIKRGEIVSVVGPSGAGKSTLLNIIGCLDNFQKGSLFLMEKSLGSRTVEELSTFRNRHLGFIFQQHNLLLEFTALENIMMPLLIRRMRKREAGNIAWKLLERFKLEDRAGHTPAELSGGECQRIAVARAIVAEPDIILADEPTGSLDRENSRHLIETLLELGQETNATIIIVTHDMKIAGRTERTISLIDGMIEDDIQRSG
ncbi:MAG: ABC transporter ATP-binding protein [bacterium]|nr:ABC transporter ATP-binding protein [bacterium]